MNNYKSLKSYSYIFIYLSFSFYIVVSNRNGQHFLRYKISNCWIEQLDVLLKLVEGNSNNNYKNLMVHSQINGQFSFTFNKKREKQGRGGNE